MMSLIFRIFTDCLQPSSKNELRYLGNEGLVYVVAQVSMKPLTQPQNRKLFDAVYYFNFGFIINHSFAN